MIQKPTHKILHIKTTNSKNINKTMAIKRLENCVINTKYFDMSLMPNENYITFSYNIHSNVYMYVLVHHFASPHIQFSTESNN